MRRRLKLFCCIVVTLLAFITTAIVYDDMPSVSVTAVAEIAEPKPTLEPGEPVVLEESRDWTGISLVSVPVQIPDMTLTDGQKYPEPLVASDSKNLLIVASDPSAWNFDTIMVVSFSESLRETRVISFPRDLHIRYGQWVRDRLEAVQPGLIDQAGMAKINAAHAIGDKIAYKDGYGRFDKPYVDFLADLIEETCDIRVDDFFYVRNKGFRNIVDYFGGVTLTVPVFMNYDDPYQDLHIHLEKGRQHLNGDQAEQFVRFRQGFDEAGVFQNYGDLFRKQNQTAFVKAFIAQNLTLANLARIGPITEFVSGNLVTSLKDWNRIVDYGALAEAMVNEDWPVVAQELKLHDANEHGLSYVAFDEVIEDESTNPGTIENDPTGNEAEQ